MKQNIQTLLDQLNHGLVERENTVKAALLAVLAGENIVLFGPPGTGKSLIARRVADCLAPIDNKPAYFEYLLTKFSTPEEIFGPLSIAELKLDKLKRNTESYLPSVRLAFLDEIFKASSSILNALLTILNERIFHNGSQPEQVPLKSLIAASNELPSDQEELAALYDRFLFRVFVDYVSPANFSKLFDQPGEVPNLLQLTQEDLEHVAENTDRISLSPEVIEAIQRIWFELREVFKEDRRENLSDRRLKKAIKLTQVSAMTNGRDAVDFSDIFLLKDCLWNHPENSLKVGQTILKILESYNRPVQNVSATSAEPALPAALKSPAQNSTGKLNARIRGYKGEGTESDPILIENLHDLLGLEDEQVGRQGYYFRQNEEIDCSELTTWMVIDFKGHYDGNGYTIKGKMTEEIQDSWFQTEKVQNALFQNIGPNATVKNLQLEELCLAVNCNESKIQGCVTSNTLIKEECLNNSIIKHCEAAENIIGGNAKNSTIFECRSRNTLVKESVTASSIYNCEVFFILKNHNHTYGICQELKEQSSVTNCYIWGRILTVDSTLVYGICRVIKNENSIKRCSIGNVDTNNSKLKLVPLINQIFTTGGRKQREKIEQQLRTNLEGNICIDSNPTPNYQSDEVINNAIKRIPAAIFNQRYFEHTLGWDFENIWIWNKEENRPTLRSVGLQLRFAGGKPDAAIETKASSDLLTEQIRSNIWL